MQTIRKIYNFISVRFRILTEKKYTTMAGTLVFFLLLSLAPFCIWVTLLFGELPEGSDEILNMQMFAEVKSFLLFFRENAARVSSGATFFLGLTSLWSASNFFYQLRRCGEIIYGEQRKKGGWKVRLSAVVLTLLTVVLLIVFLGIFVVAVWFLRRYLSDFFAEFFGYVLLLVLAFFACWALNVYLSPRRLRAGEAVKGSCITAVLWGIAVLLFSLYLRLGNMEKLYGAMTTLIVFLLWAYIMMVCFVVGVIYNEHYAGKQGAPKKF